MNLEPYHVRVGFFDVGVVCSGHTEFYALEYALHEFGFDGTLDYNKCYPGTGLGNSNDSHNLKNYAITFIMYCSNLKQRSIMQMLFSADSVNTGRPSLSNRRALLRGIYQGVEFYRPYIFPTMEAVKEAFCYKKLEPTANFWFCTDWKG